MSISHILDRWLSVGVVFIVVVVDLCWVRYCVTCIHVHYWWDELLKIHEGCFVHLDSYGVKHVGISLWLEWSVTQLIWISTGIGFMKMNLIMMMNWYHMHSIVSCRVTLHGWSLLVNGLYWCECRWCGYDGCVVPLPLFACDFPVIFWMWILTPLMFLCLCSSWITDKQVPQ